MAQLNLSWHALFRVFFSSSPPSLGSRSQMAARTHTTTSFTTPHKIVCSLHVLLGHVGALLNYPVQDFPGKMPQLTAGSDFCHHQQYFRLPYDVPNHKIQNNGRVLIRYAGVTCTHFYAVQTIQLINLHRILGFRCIAFAIFGFSHYFGTQTCH